MCDRKWNDIVAQGKHLRGLVHGSELTCLDMLVLAGTGNTAGFSSIEFELPGRAAISLDTANVLGVDQRSDCGRSS